MKPHRFLNMVYAWAIERIASDKFDEWHNDLYDLLPWQDSSSEAAANMESESFMQMMSKG